MLCSSNLISAEMPIVLFQSRIIFDIEYVSHKGTDEIEKWGLKRV